MTQPTSAATGAVATAVAPPLAATAPATFEVALAPEQLILVKSKATQGVQDLVASELMSDDFRQRVDAMFALGRAEIAEATRVTSTFLERNNVGMEHTAAFAAMNQLADVWEELHPSKWGQLTGTYKIWGVLPGGSKVKAYFRKFKESQSVIDSLMVRLSRAQDDITLQMGSLDDTRKSLWDSLQQLTAAEELLKSMQASLEGRIAELSVSDPTRATLLTQEVLPYLVQNLEGVMTQKVVNTTAFLGMDPLKKTARQLWIGVDRMKTTGMSALATAQMVAIATGQQMETNHALEVSKAALGKVIVGTSELLKSHVESVAKSSAAPLLAVTDLTLAMDNTLEAVQSFDRLRAEAVQQLKESNKALETLVQKADKKLLEFNPAA